MNTRSVTSTHTASVLRVLHKDFPSDDTTVRLVLLLTVFLSDSSHLPENFLPTPATSQLFERYVETCSDEIEDMDLGPLTRKDIIDILLSKFVPERFGGILEYARSVLDLDKEAMRSVVTEVALGCLEIGCKGKMLAKLVAAYPYLSDVIATHIVKTYRIQLEDLPPVEDEKACKEYAAPLCADLLMTRRGIPMTFEEAAVPPIPPTAEPAPPPQPESEPAENEEEAEAGEDEVEEGAEGPETPAEADGEDLVRAPCHMWPGGTIR